MLSKKQHIVLIFLFCLPSYFFLFNPAKFPADDGFFYPQIAYNIVQGIGMKFNDLYPTNGFHPLWMFFCVVSEILNFHNKEDVVYILWLFQTVFTGIGFYYLKKNFFSENLFSSFLGIAFLSLVLFSLGTLFLTEAHLNFLTIILLLSYLVKDKKNDWLFGFLLSLLFLARLDNIFIIPFFGIYYWKQNFFSIKNLCNILIGFSILSVPYLYSNYYYFESIIPISGKIKSSFPYIKSNLGMDSLQKIFFLSNTGYLFFLAVTKCRDRELKIYYVIGSIILLLYNLIFQSQIGQWYYVAQMIATAMFIYDFAKIFQNKLLEKKYFLIFSLVSILLFLCTVSWLKLTTSLSIANNVMSKNSKFENQSDDTVKIFANQLSNEIPPKSRIFVYDFPGKFAFYSNFNVIPADGLVANKHFFKELDSNPFKKYLQSKKIYYLILPYYLNKKIALSSIGVTSIGYHENVKYYIKNSLEKKVVDSLKENRLYPIKAYKNPIKNWQKDYDSIRIYKIK